MFSRERMAIYFGIFIRLVFLFAFGAFLRASIQHIADFFQTFEGADQSIGYTLAIAIDGTSLVLTAGLMFFKRNMSAGVFWGIWAFIIFLTGFSWVINWQYAVSHQNDAFIGHLDPFWKTANPIFASSFAVLNIAYTIVAEAFNHKAKTDEELQEELSELTGPRAKLRAQIAAAKAEAKAAQPGFIQKARDKAIEVKKAAAEVIDSGKQTDVSPVSSAEANEMLGTPLSGDVANEEREDDDVVTSDVSEPVIPSLAPDLDFIEQTMYNRLVSQPDALQELQIIAQQTDLAGLILYLRKRFSGYASYFTEERVRHVMEAIQCDPTFDEEVHVSEHRTDPLAGDQKGSVANETAEDLTEVAAVSTGELEEDGEGSVANESNGRNQEVDGTGRVRQTEPEMEALNVTNFPGNGSVAEVIDVAKRRKPFSVAEAAQVLECTEKTIREMRKRGALEHVEGNEKLLTAASVRGLWNERQKNKKAVS